MEKYIILVALVKLGIMSEETAMKWGKRFVAFDVVLYIVMAIVGIAFSGVWLYSFSQF